MNNIFVYHRHPSIMNLVKKVGKTVSETAKSAVLGIESESLKLRKRILEEMHEEDKATHMKYLAIMKESSKILILIESNDKIKLEHLTKLTEVPLSNTMLQNACKQVVEILSVANEGLHKNVSEFHAAAGDFDAEKMLNTTERFESEVGKINKRLSEIRNQRSNTAAIKA